MTTLEGTSAVEGVGSREQGNTQTQGESHRSGKGATKGQQNKNKHTVANRKRCVSENTNQANTLKHKGPTDNADPASGVYARDTTQKSVEKAATWTA